MEAQHVPALPRRLRRDRPRDGGRRRRCPQRPDRRDEDGPGQEARRQSRSPDQLPTFDLARSRYVISFGADFLGTWNSPVAQNAAYGDMRQRRPGVRGKLVQVETRMSQTGANADEWVPIRPGTEGVLALGLA